MNSDEVWDHVCRELGDKRETSYGWHFGDFLVNPPYQGEYNETDGSTSTYWVVLKQSDDGYHIVFDGHDCQYYLATGGTVVGMYGTSLMKTIEDM